MARLYTPRQGTLSQIGEGIFNYYNTRVAAEKRAVLSVQAGLEYAALGKELASQISQGRVLVPNEALGELGGDLASRQSIPLPPDQILIYGMKQMQEAAPLIAKQYQLEGQQAAFFHQDIAKMTPHIMRDLATIQTKLIGKDLQRTKLAVFGNIMNGMSEITRQARLTQIEPEAGGGIRLELGERGGREFARIIQMVHEIYPSDATQTQQLLSQAIMKFAYNMLSSSVLDFSDNTTYFKMLHRKPIQVILPSMEINGREIPQTAIALSSLPMGKDGGTTVYDTILSRIQNARTAVADQTTRQENKRKKANLQKAVEMLVEIGPVVNDLPKPKQIKLWREFWAWAAGKIPMSDAKNIAAAFTNPNSFGVAKEDVMRNAFNTISHLISVYNTQESGPTIPGLETQWVTGAGSHVVKYSEVYRQIHEAFYNRSIDNIEKTTLLTQLNDAQKPKVEAYDKAVESAQSMFNTFSLNPQIVRSAGRSNASRPAHDEIDDSVVGQIHALFMSTLDELVNKRQMPKSPETVAIAQYSTLIKMSDQLVDVIRQSQTFNSRDATSIAKNKYMASLIQRQRSPATYLQYNSWRGLNKLISVLTDKLISEHNWKKDYIPLAQTATRRLRVNEFEEYMTRPDYAKTFELRVAVNIGRNNLKKEWAEFRKEGPIDLYPDPEVSVSPLLNRDPYQKGHFPAGRTLNWEWFNRLHPDNRGGKNWGGNTTLEEYYAAPPELAKPPQSDPIIAPVVKKPKEPEEKPSIIDDVINKGREVVGDIYDGALDIFGGGK